MGPFESYVNEIVASLRASHRRKAKIREELLSHLQEAANAHPVGECEEVERVARVIERFGDREEVRGRIQAIVPRLERVMYSRLFSRKHGEKDLAYAWRVSASIAFSFCSVLGMFVGAKLFVMGKSAVVVKAMTVGGISVAYMLSILFIAFWAILRYNRAFREGQFRLAVAIVLIFSICSGAMVLSTFVAAAVIVPQFQAYIPVAGLVCCAGAALLAFVTIAEAMWKLRHSPWEKLGEDL
jgi:hypothetical protein